MKLSFWTIIIMAISVSVAILSFAWLHQAAPTIEATKRYTEYHDALQAEANKETAANRRVDHAKRAVRLEEARWNGYVAVRTPESDVSRGGVSLAVNPFQLTVDTQKFRNSVQRAVNAQIRKGGVKSAVGGDVPGPTNTDSATLLADYYNYPSLKFPVVIYDLGPITVQGTYAQIMANVRSYKSMPHYLAVADALQITGTSPNLTGTYNLTVVGYIRGKDIFPPNTAPVTASLPGAASGATRAGVPGAMGGAPFGRSGMPGVPGGGAER